MNQFDKNKIITLDIQEPQQIKNALIQYQTLLNNNQVCNNQLFDVEFKQSASGELRRLQPSDAGTNLELLKSALDKGQEGGSHYYDHEITDETETYISEVILFAAALQYPEIKETVVETAKAIVTYSRRANDTDSMWLDDMRVFGIEAVYMLAKTDLQYAYLVAQFFVPYWDDEHANEYESYLAAFLVEYGWHPEVLKAFIWCDNPSFRLGMFMDDPYDNSATYQPLGGYLTENPSQYTRFKQMVVERFQAEPVLLYSIDEYDEEDLSRHNPVVWLYDTLFPRCRHFDDEEMQDAFMQQPFMGSTLENEAYDLQQLIQSQVTGALVKTAESALEKRASYKAYLERDEHRYDLNYGSEVLKPLILALPQGERLWRYIENGTELDALEALEEIELLPLAKEHAPIMYAQMNDHLSSWDYNNRGILDELEGVLDLVRGDLTTDHFGEESTIELDNGLITTLTVTRDNDITLLEARRQQYLRVVDVFYRALGKHEFSEYMMASLTEEDEPLLSRQDYYRRYSQLPVSGAETNTEAGADPLDPALTRDVHSIFDIFTDPDEILYSKYFQRVDSVLRSSRELCHPKYWSQPDMGFLALASYQLYNDFNQRIGDNVTEALFNYLNEHNVWNMAVSQILTESRTQSNASSSDNTGLSDTDIVRIREYFTADKPEDDQASLLALLEPHLFRDNICRGELYVNKFSEYQPSYKLFNDFNEDFQRFTLVAFWLRQLPLPLRIQADRLWQFLITLAPVRVARNIMRAHSDNPYNITFNNVLDDINVQEQLEKAGIDAGILSAYEMSCQFNDTERYQHWIDVYSEITSTATSMFGSLDRKKAQAMHEGLKYINEETRIEFLHHASLKYPDIPSDLAHDLKRVLHILIQLNIRSWEDPLAYEYGESCLYIGEGDDVPTQLCKPIVADQDTVHDKPCHIDGMSWLNCTVLQQRGEQHNILMADQNVPLENYERGLPRGTLLIFAEEVESKALLARITQLQDTSARIEYLVEQTLAYLDDKVDYDAIATLYAAHIATDNFRPSAGEYRLYSTHQFIWVLDKPRRDRLVKLLLNHNYCGFKVLEENYQNCWLHHQLAQGEIDFNTYFERERENNHDNETSEEAMHFLLNWLVEIDINPAHITRFCIKHSRFEACCEFIQSHARGSHSHNNHGSFAQTLSYLHAGQRRLLPKILSQASDAAELMEPLTKDKSRLVKIAIANCFS
ncbi:hypothetical protein [Photobacterium nomapromontoriensis]|uniref:hypothetical protein n=1 Tax=Photobacterium nomapromontoriensis TaxID=2910237 RepID=UPI003D0AF142